MLLAHGDSIDKDLFKTLMSKTGHKSYDDVELVDALWGALDVNHDQEVDTKELILGAFFLLSHYVLLSAFLSPLLLYSSTLTFWFVETEGLRSVGVAFKTEG